MMDFLEQDRKFDFCYGEIPFRDCSFTVTKSEEGNTVTTVYLFSDGLKVTNITKKYEEFGALEWVNWFENTADSETQIISGLYDCSVTLPMEWEDDWKRSAYMPNPKTDTVIYNPSGSTFTEKEFYVEIDELEGDRYRHHIVPGMTKEYQPFGGRSSDTTAPFFHVSKNGKGFLFAVGWTGQWKCAITRNNESITVKSGIEDVSFRLYPGEKIRTSSFLLMPAEGDFITCQNRWRKLLKKEFSLIGSPGRDSFGPLCAGIWGGMKTESVMKRLEMIKQYDLPFEYIWMDAGWYGEDTQPTPNEYEGDWSAHTGDWRISRHVHPNGLKDVTEAVHAAGKKFLLWIEPERVVYNTPTAVQHPEYFLVSETKTWYKLLNLGEEQAWQYCYRTLSELVRELKLDCLRQDYNMNNTLPYWRENDRFDRKGLTEIKYIMGLYRLWDALLDEFPHLLIDNCASGGRRIDIETIRRSIPLWRSDYQCAANYPAKGAQIHHMTFNTWIPYSGTSSGRIYDTYQIRSAYTNAMTTNYTFSETDSFGDDPDKMKWLKKHLNEYLKVRPYFTEDLYYLTEPSERTDMWSAVQFDRPEQHDGVIQVFRREDSPFESASFQLGGMDEEAEYLLTDADTGETNTLSGKMLKNGFTVTMPEKRSAKIYFYCKKERS